MIEGYERNKDIPKAGFAAGPCLYKDTAQLNAFLKNSFTLGKEATKINQSLPIEIYKRLKKKFGKSGAYALAWAQHKKHGKPTKEEAAGVGIVTKQNTTPDVNAKTLNKMLRNLHLIK